MKIKKAGVFEVKAHLSEILKEVEQGTTYLVTNRGREVAELRPCRDIRPHPKAGFAKGTVVHIADDFDEPLEDFRDRPSTFLKSINSPGSTAIRSIA